MVRKTHRFRVLLVAFVSLLVFGVILARLYQIQILQHKRYARLARSQQQKTVVLNPRRGDILDRNGEVLATSAFRDTVFLNPAASKKDPPADFALRVGRLLGLPEEKLRDGLERKKVTLLARKVEPEVVEALRVLEADLDLPDGLIFYEKESKRLYPQGDLAGPVLGFTTIDQTGDNVGIAGLEVQYDKELKGRQKKQKVQVNVWRQGLAPLEEENLGDTFGSTLGLTLDARLQHYAQKALRKRVGELQALGGVAVVMDVKTGGILALALCPDFDPGDWKRASEQQRRNRALTDPIEIGSVMKILTATILIDNHLLTPDETVDCEGGFGLVEGRPFKDSHPLGMVPFRAAFAESSNIAAAKLGLRLQPELYYTSLKRFGLGEKSEIDLPYEGGGILYPLSKWTHLSRTSLPVGYETSMTPLQVVASVGAVANGGVRMKPYIVDRISTADGRTIKQFAPEEADRVARPETCATMLELMEGVVTDGTGKGAKVPGYRVAAKTGTTRKSQFKGEKRYYSSIAGVIPASDPRLVIYVMVDEPDPKIEYYGGKVSAPVFAEIARDAVRILGIAPDDPASLKDAEEPRKDANAGDAGDADYREVVDGLDAFADESGAMAGRELASAAAAQSAMPMPEAVAETILPGRMPRLLGLTMSEALARAAEAEVEIKVRGTGIVTEQEPPAGIELASGQTALVVFTPAIRGEARPVSARPQRAAQDAPALPEL